MAPGSIEALTLWLAQTNASIVAPDGPGGECALIDAPPEPGAILERPAALAHPSAVGRRRAGTSASPSRRRRAHGSPVKRCGRQRSFAVRRDRDHLVAGSTVLPGHGPATTTGREPMTNPFNIELLQGGFE